MARVVSAVKSITESGRPRECAAGSGEGFGWTKTTACWRCSSAFVSYNGPAYLTDRHQLSADLGAGIAGIDGIVGQYAQGTGHRDLTRGVQARSSRQGRPRRRRTDH
jgi:hypothetical protein